MSGGRESERSAETSEPEPERSRGTLAIIIGLPDDDNLHTMTAPMTALLLLLLLPAAAAGHRTPGHRSRLERAPAERAFVVEVLPHPARLGARQKQQVP